MKVIILFNRSEGYEEYPGANIEAALPKKKRRKKKKSRLANNTHRGRATFFKTNEDSQ